MLRVFGAEGKLKILNEECESEMHVKEKEKCEMFLTNVKN